MARESQPVRLYVNGAILGYQRGLRTQNNSCSLIKIKGVDSKEDTEFYLGKKIAFITKASTPGKDGSRFRVNWGKVCRAMEAMVLSDAGFLEICPHSLLEEEFELCFTLPVCKHFMLRMDK
eukprot:CAMPEP_0184871426 /NCGR_PEP_ID=MMETSP0580-20130426/40711_1 /TAXON_ID=1118495 /ORGANISM="Dactyliosolen fragilissimus" /LENGTH=120 /DNA_ID=CAMNT_0027374085 /DNA_START=707 /DNA_END=1070 /DNA_ORIENTATION=-